MRLQELKKQAVACFFPQDPRSIIFFSYLLTLRASTFNWYRAKNSEILTRMSTFSCIFPFKQTMFAKK